MSEQSDLVLGPPFVYLPHDYGQTPWLIVKIVCMNVLYSQTKLFIYTGFFQF